jgi:secreted trypsin-like serine protease
MQSRKSFVQRKSLIFTISALITLVFLVFTNIADKANSIVVPGAPNDYQIKVGASYNGVMKLNLQLPDYSTICSGVLLPTGLHILTAAHCLTSSTGIYDKLPGVPLGSVIVKNVTAAFDLPTDEKEIKAVEYYIHPNWNGNYYNGNDIAIIKLATQAPASAKRYNIYQGNQELKRVHTKVGYGFTGNGNSGYILNVNYKKRAGQNIYDGFGEVLNKAFDDVNFPQGAVLVYDFDNGKPINDALGVSVGIHDLGLGKKEVYPSFGDSGGPIFIDGLIAGIVSDGIRQHLPSEVDDVPYNCSFGEIGFDTRVSFFSNYIDNVLKGKLKPTYEPV